MKRILLIMVMLLTVVGAKAQVTMNARVGTGMVSDNPSIVGLFQVNIPFKKGGRFTFSPSLEYDHSLPTSNDDYDRINSFESKMLLGSFNFGIKASLGSKVLLIPKVGWAFGGDFGGVDEKMITGPSTEIAFEYKHFIVAASGFYSIIDCDKDFYEYSYYYSTYRRGWFYYNSWKFAITLGYKF